MPSMPSMKLKALLRATIQNTPTVKTRTPSNPGASERIVGGYNSSNPTAARAWRTAFTPKWRLDRSSASPTAHTRAAAASSGHSPTGRSIDTPASIPRNMATPPSLGVGTSCELRRLGTSSRFRPTANLTSSGTNAPATRKATPPATTPVTVVPAPYANGLSILIPSTKRPYIFRKQTPGASPESPCPPYLILVHRDRRAGHADAARFQHSTLQTT